MTPAPTGQQRDLRCPYCHAATAPGQPICLTCGTRLTGPEVAEIAWIDGELARLSAQWVQLSNRRASLVASLRREAITSQPVSLPGLQPQPAPRPVPTTPPARPDVSRRTAATLLLTAGAVLLGLAALFFTAVNWGRIGPAGRVAVLAAAAAIAIAAGWPLARRGLRCTAEAVTALGLGLTLLAALAAHALAAIQSLGPSHLYGAAVSAVLAAAWAAYGSMAPTRAIRPAAIVIGQFCLPLVASTHGLTWTALAFLADAIAGLAIVWWAGRREARAESVTGTVTGITTWAVGGLLVLLGLVHSAGQLRFMQLIALLVLAIAIGCVSAVALGGALRPAVIWPAAAMSAGAITAVAVAGAGPGQPAPLLSWAAAGILACGAAGAVLARRGTVARIATGLAVAAAVGLALAAPLTAGWPVRMTGFTLLGLAALAAAAATLIYRQRSVLALILDAGAALAGVLAAAAALPDTRQFCVVAGALGLLAGIAALLRTGNPRACAIVGAVAAAGASLVLQLRTLGNAAILPARTLGNPWHGGPAAHALAAARPGLPVAVAVLGAAVVTVAIAAWAWHGRELAIDVATPGLVVLAAPAAALISAGAWATPAALLALTIAVLAIAVARYSPVRAAAAVAAVLLTLARALAGDGPTLLVLGCVAAGYAATAWRARADGYRAVAAFLTVLTGGGLVAAAVLAAGLAGRLAGGATVAVSTLAVLGSWVLSSRARSVSRAVEPAGWLLLGAGTLAELGNGPDTGLAITAASALCLAVSARPGRGALRAAGVTLMVIGAANWLAGSAGPAPEPYSLPAAAIALAAGWYWSRRAPQVSSWSFAGPGLALGFAPSLGAALAGTGWVRPLALLAAAAVVAVAGARLRLAAAVVLGTAAVLAAALEPFGPAAIHLVFQLPRWVPVAIIGAVLLGCGATFEARLRDLRKVHGAISKMR